MDRSARAIRRLPLLLVVALLAVGILGVFFFILFGKQIAPLLEPEVFKQTYQLVLITIVGGGIALVYRQFDRARDDRDRDRETQREVRSELVKAYNQAKSARRLLMAKAISSTGDMIKGAPYDEQLQILNEAQLALEAAIHTIQSDTRVFGANSDLAIKLGSVENYLNDILHEYEINFRHFSSDPATKRLAEFPMLSNFVAWSVTGGDFKTRCAEPFDEALKTLTRLIRP